MSHNDSVDCVPTAFQTFQEHSDSSFIPIGMRSLERSRLERGTQSRNAVTERSHNAWGDGYCDAESWLVDEEPDPSTLVNDTLALPALNDEWLVNYQAGWCAALVDYMDGHLW